MYILRPKLNRIVLSSWRIFFSNKNVNNAAILWLRTELRVFQSKDKFLNKLLRKIHIFTLY